MNIDTHEETFVDHYDSDIDQDTSEEYRDYGRYFGDILALSTPELAEEYLDDVLDTATETEYNDILKAFMGAEAMRPSPSYGEALMAPQETNSGAKTGGGLTAEDMLEDFFALVDTFHDFNNIPYPGRAPKNLVAVADIVAALGDPVRPVGFEDLDDLRCPTRFIDKISSITMLDFGNGVTMKNPLCNAKVVHSYEIPYTEKKAGRSTYAVTNINYDNAVYAVKRSGRIALIADYEGKRKALRLQQVADVIATMRAVYGTAATFVVDNSDEHLMQLLTGKVNLAKGFYKKFTTDKPVTKLGRLLRDNNIVLKDVDWDLALCDANMIDAENGSDIPVRKDATGPVFRERAHTQVTLGGVIDGPKFLMAVGIEPLTERAIPFIGGSSRDVAVACTGLAPSAMAGHLATKRAADWGQIRHCAKYSDGKRLFVFVTSDEFAAYFAITKRVASMKTCARAYSDAGLRPAFCVMDFAMAAPPRAPPQRGAGTSFAIPIVALVTLIASTVIGSIHS